MLTDSAFLTELSKRDKTGILFIPELMYSVHLRIHHWVKAQEMSNEAVEVPNLVELLMSVKLESWIHPTLPESVLSKIKPPEAPAPRARVPAGDRSSQGPGTPGRAPAGAPALGDRVFNTAALAAIQFNTAADLRGLQRSNPNVPSNDAGTSMCLSYHKRGQCYANCTRKEDHKVHSAGETDRLLAYVGEGARA